MASRELFDRFADWRTNSPGRPDKRQVAQQEIFSHEKPRFAKVVAVERVGQECALCQLKQVLDSSRN